MSTHNLVLHHYWRSSCSWRLRWALAHKGVQYQSVPVNLLNNEHLRSEYLKINPAGAVPCLVIDGIPYTQSLAIIQWIDERFPNRPLFPSSAIDRLKSMQLSLIIAADTQPLQNLSPQKYFSSDPAKRSEYARHWIEKGLATYETLVRSVAGTFSMGGEITVADLCLIPQCYNALRFNVDLNQFPTVHRIYTNALKVRECDISAPYNQPGADSGAQTSGR